MPKDHTFRFGKTTVSVEVTGCVSCGTRWSSGWTVVRVIPIQVGERKSHISLQTCADCKEAAKCTP